MSALPPKADIAERHWDVRFVPKAEIRQHDQVRVAYVKMAQLWLEGAARIEVASGLMPGSEELG